MKQQPVVSLNTSGGARLLNLTQVVLEHRQLLQLSRRREEEEEAYFVDYIPPARDAITLPPNVVYVLVGVVLVIVATYAIVGHLIKDLMHDLAGNIRLVTSHSHQSTPTSVSVVSLSPFPTPESWVEVASTFCISLLLSSLVTVLLDDSPSHLFWGLCAD